MRMGILESNKDRPMTEETALAVVTPTGELSTPSQNPAAIYLASLGSELSRQTMLAALDTIAQIISNGGNTVATLQWGALRFQHTQAIRAALSARFKHTTANKMLSALRGVIKVA